MTRINSAIPPKCLTDEHLLAEHREIKRLPAYLNKAILSGNIKCIPSKFTLGHGHVLFFLDKMEFIRWRYSEIYLEAIIRGFNIIKYHSNFQCQDDVLLKYWNTYNTSNEEKQLLITRIKQRIIDSKKKYWHYYRKPITKEEAIKLLDNF